MSYRNRFRRSNNAIRPVHRIKHVVDFQGGITLNVQNTQTLISTVDAPTLASSSEVETGAKVNGIYLHVEVYATSSASLSNVYLAVAKNPGNNLTFPNANVIGADDNKRYVIHQEMVMLQKVTPSNPRTLFNGVIVLPRGYRRMGPNDRLLLFLFAPGVNIDFCVQCHYKEFR